MPRGLIAYDVSEIVTLDGDVPSPCRTSLPVDVWGTLTKLARRRSRHKERSGRGNFGVEGTPTIPKSKSSP